VCKALIRGWPRSKYLEADWAGKNLLLKITARMRVRNSAGKQKEPEETRQLEVPPPRKKPILDGNQLLMLFSLM
jgi:hypothetical protein